MGHVKAASASELSKAAGLLQSIYEENPSHWPHGLTPDHFDPGDLFLVRKQANEAPVGFVGWQERNIKGARVGMYSVGTLPEYRGMGVASKAVSKLLGLKSAGVDRVQALVVPGNTPSEKLAKRLNVPVMKAAGIPWKGIGSLLGHTAVGTAGAALLDKSVLGDRGTIGLIQGNPQADPGAKWDSLFNILTLSSGSALMKKNPLGAALVGSMGPLSTIGSAAARNQAAGNLIAAEQVKATRDAGNAQSTPTGGMSTPALLGAAGVLAGALGLGAYGVSKAIKDKEPQTINMTNGGRLRVTLPTKNPGDAETTVELPYDPNTAMTTALRDRLDLDTRRRLYAETRSRIHRRGQKAPLQNVN